MPKISVIIPTYNVEDKIDKCLNSLANQSFEDIEFIVLDDGSKDKTFDIIKKYKEMYPEKFNIISKDNEGISATRNKGIELAKGEYIGFVDGDDFIENNMYEKLYDRIIENDSDIVFCDYFEIGKNKKVKVMGDKDFSGNLRTNPELINKMYFSPWNKLYKKTLFDDIRFPLDTKYEDLEAILKVFLKAKKIEKVDLPLYNYVLNDNGETFTIDENVYDILKVYNHLVMYFKELKDNESMYREFEKLSTNSLFEYVRLLVTCGKFDYVFIYDFYLQVLNFLDKYFKSWKMHYIFATKNFKDFFVRTMYLRPKNYLKFLKKRRKYKKDILFTGFTLQTGGVSKALINLLNNLDYEKYNITLLLQIDGELSSQVNSKVKVKHYNLSKVKNKIFRKIINVFKYIKLLFDNRKAYDFSICYEPGYPLSSRLALIASSNNAAWMHTNILKYMEYSMWFEKVSDVTEKAKRFVNRMYFRKFKKNVFVSNNSLEAYLNVYPEDKEKCIVCHNFIDYKSMLKKSEEKIELKKDERYTFVNVSRHTEFDKQITLLIDAAKKLKEENGKFKVLLIGDGPDHKKYVDLIKKYGLEENIAVLGKKLNPFPYYKISDAFVLTSNFEGYPVVFNESLVMNLPIITTDVSDAKMDIDGKYGRVVSSDSDSFYLAMKEFVLNNEKIEDRFDPDDFNKEIIEKIDWMICDEN